MQLRHNNNYAQKNLSHFSPRRIYLRSIYSMTLQYSLFFMAYFVSLTKILSFSIVDNHQIQGSVKEYGKYPLTKIIKSYIIQNV